MSDRLTKPAPWYEKRVKFQPRAFAESLSGLLTGGAATAATGSPIPAIAAATDTLVRSVGLEEDPVGTAYYRLALAALLKASMDLVKEFEDRLATAPENVLSVKDRLGDALEGYSVHPNLFEHPERLELLEPVKDVLKQWGIVYNLREAEAGAFAARLSGYFPDALFRVSLDEAFSGDLEQVKSLQDNPFLEGRRRRLAWERYKRHLDRLLAAPVLDEVFALKDIYLPVRAVYAETQDGADKSLKPREWVDLEAELNTWLGNDNDFIRVVSGGPGSGKSSFAKHYAARVMNDGAYKVLYLPLVLFPKGKSLEAGVGDVLARERILSHNPLTVEGDEPRLLVILDGLDELAMTSEGALAEVSRLLREVYDLAPRIGSGRDVKWLLLGRTNTVGFEQHERGIRSEHILELLPYFLRERQQGAEEPNAYGPYLITNVPLPDQREAWWDKFSRLKGLETRGVPEKLDTPPAHPLSELTGVPILNYLVAWNYLQDPEDFDPDGNVNELYENLFKSVYKRSWGQGGNRAAQPFSFGEFAQVYGSIALAAWHVGGGRSARLADIVKVMWPYQVKKRYEGLEPDLKYGALRTLTAFYTRLNEPDEEDDPTFEFVHKSFGEYLTARRLVARIEAIHEGLSHEFGEETALNAWIEDCATGLFTDDLRSFIEREVALLTDAATARERQETVGALLRYGLTRGLPMHNKPQFPNYRAMESGARTALLGLLVMHQAFGKQSEQPLRFVDDDTSARHLLAFLQAGVETSAVFELPFSYADFSGVDLTMTNLGRVDLYKAKLNGANLAGADLALKKFSGADLRGAGLFGADLGGANLAGADLHETELHYANLREVNLSGANLAGAKLGCAILSGADLGGADLSGADLGGANLRGADLSEAILKGADLSEANLSERLEITS